ncbi:MAG: hypothetical protein ABSH38_12135 [Verrucomicrobiota bacterium]|jgi:hypothetical protein
MQDNLTVKQTRSPLVAKSTMDEIRVSFDNGVEASHWGWIVSTIG